MSLMWPHLCQWTRAMSVAQPGGVTHLWVTWPIFAMASRSTCYLRLIAMLLTGTDGGSYSLPSWSCVSVHVLSVSRTLPVTVSAGVCRAMASQW